MCEACSAHPTRIALGRIVIDLGALRIERGRRSVRLTAGEAAVLFILIARANELVPSEDIVALLHPAVSLVQGRARVKFVIVQLRKKLGRARRWLETVHGRGYLLKLAGQAAKARDGRRASKFVQRSGGTRRARKRIR